jgi:hypothetical protein
VRKRVKQFKRVTRVKRVKRHGQIKIALARLLGRRGQHPTMPQSASGRGLPRGEVRSRLAFKARRARAKRMCVFRVLRVF